MNRKELDYILDEDLKRFDGKRPALKDWFLHNEVWYIYKYILHLRYVEYHKNKKGWHRIAFLYHWFKYKRLGFRLHFTIYPNTCNGGLRVYHSGGFIHVGDKCHIGHNCTLLPGVVFGNKYEIPIPNSDIFVGDNCYFGLDSKIFGPVKIGNNVTVGANAIVTKDVPDNTIVVGVNRIIKK